MTDSFRARRRNLQVSVKPGQHHAALQLVAALALGWWALDEIGRGVNPWRRLLGAVVLGGLVASLPR
jgi:hypothetical protein